LGFADDELEVEEILLSVFFQSGLDPNDPLVFVNRTVWVEPSFPFSIRCNTLSFLS
jgi:hypothetical protein